jgi:hypothetical protein
VTPTTAGDVDLANPDTFVNGVPHDALTELRRTDPVHWQPMAGEPGFWAVLRHTDVAHVARHPEIFSASEGGFALEDLLPGPSNRLMAAEQTQSHDNIGSPQPGRATKSRARHQYTEPRTFSGRCFSNGPRPRRRRSWPSGGTTSGHRGCARRRVHRLGDWCRFGRDREGFATVLDNLVRVLTGHTALEEKAVLPVAEKSG